MSDLKEQTNEDVFAGEAQRRISYSNRFVINSVNGSDNLELGEIGTYFVNDYLYYIVKDVTRIIKSPQSFIRNNVKWDIKIDNNTSKLLDERGNEIKGERIEIRTKPEWARKEIILMPYLRRSTESVSVKINVLEEEQKPMPDPHTVTQKFGARPGESVISGNPPHAGVDLISINRKIQAAKSGTVLFAGIHPNGKTRATGTLIIIKYNDGNYGLYGHLDPDDIKVTVGSIVSVGTILATYFNGKMGLSTGGHLHYAEYKPINPPSERNALARYFDSTGYFYGKTSVPADKKLKNSSGIEIEVIEPIWNEYKI